MTTESLSPASRIVIETFSSPPGERSTSISLIGGAEDAAPMASAVARGAMFVAVTPVVEPSSANAKPATKGAEGGAPNGVDCGVDGAANSVGSGSAPSAALALDPAGAGGEAEPEARRPGGAADTSGFRPLRAASCEAARAALTRLVEGEPARGAAGAGAAAPVSDGTAPAKGAAAIALAREKPATEALSPLTSAPEKLAAAGANGASFPRARLASVPAEVDRPRWKARSPVSRPTVALASAAGDAPLFSDFGPFTAGEASEGESSAACGCWSIIAAARKANGKDAMSALSLGSEWRAVCPGGCSWGDSFERCACSSAADASAVPVAPGSESSTAAKPKRSAEGWEATRLGAGAIGAAADAAEGAVMASLHLAVSRSSRCARAHPSPVRSSERGRWALPCRRRAKQQRFP